MKMFLFLIACIMHLSSFGQTCIIALRLKDQIVIGADSRVEIFNEKIVDGKRIAIQSYDTVCKIKQVGATFFTIAGLDYAPLTKEVIRELYQNTNLITTSIMLKKTIVPILNKYLEFLKKNYPLSFRNVIKTMYGTEIDFYKFENHVSKIVKLDCHFVETAHNVMNVESKIDTTMVSEINRENGIEFLCTGETEMVKQWYKKIHFDRNDMSSWIVQLITKQHEATPESVASPIDVISISDPNQVKVLHKESKSKCFN